MTAQIATQIKILWACVENRQRAELPSPFSTRTVERAMSAPYFSIARLAGLRAEPVDAALVARAGAIAFLKKPVHAPALLEALSAHLVPNAAGAWE